MHVVASMMLRILFIPGELNVASVDGSIVSTESHSWNRQIKTIQ